jgi:hypothetical protein
MRERILGGYDDFVLPFMIGMIFIISYLLIGAIRIIIHIPSSDRKNFYYHLLIPKLFI